VYPTWGIIQQRINIKGVMIYQDKTPLTFWSIIGFFCGLAFPYIMWHLPYAIIFLNFMIIFAVVHIAFYLLKW
jgi:hypothetical protein